MPSQAKVEGYLKLKMERDQHINTTLLSSTAFANPHIYSKLVEFVNIDERGSAYPQGGWLTRRGLEEKLPAWGSKALAETQKKAQDELDKSQAAGARNRIDFASSTASKRSSSSIHPHVPDSQNHRRRGDVSKEYPLLLPSDMNVPGETGSKRHKSDRPTHSHRSDRRDKERDRHNSKRREGIEAEGTDKKRLPRHEFGPNGSRAV